MFYVANPQDKMGRIAHEFYGNELGRLMLPRLIDSNAHTLPFYVHIVGDDVLLPPYYIVYLPEFDITHQFFPWKSMAAQLNSAPIEVRKNIGKLCESGVDPRIAIAVKNVGGDHKTDQQEAWKNLKERTDTVGNDIDDADRVHTVVETLKKQMACFDLEKAKKNMEIALAAYRDDKNIFTQKYLKDAYKVLENKFQMEVYHEIPFGIKRIQNTVLSKVSKRIFFLENHAEVRNLLEAGKRLKFIVTALGRQVPVIDDVIESITVYESYKAGDDWVKNAAEYIAGTAITAGLTAILTLTPLGWGALLVGFAADYVGERAGEDVVDYMWSHPRWSSVFANHEYANPFFQ